MQVVDLSVGGCFVATAQDVPDDTTISLHTTLLNTAVSISGRIIHVQPGRGFAVAFTTLPTESRALLTQFLTMAE